MEDGLVHLAMPLHAFYFSGVSILIVVDDGLVLYAAKTVAATVTES